MKIRLAWQWASCASIKQPPRLPSQSRPKQPRHLPQRQHPPHQPSALFTPNRVHPAIKVPANPSKWIALSRTKLIQHKTTQLWTGQRSRPNNQPGKVPAPFVEEGNRQTTRRDALPVTERRQSTARSKVAPLLIHLRPAPSRPLEKRLPMCRPNPNAKKRWRSRPALTRFPNVLVAIGSYGCLAAAPWVPSTKQSNCRSIAWLR